jgi:hypothetical protein
MARMPKHHDGKQKRTQSGSANDRTAQSSIEAMVMDEGSSLENREGAMTDPNITDTRGLNGKRPPWGGLLRWMLAKWISPTTMAA